MGSAIKKARFIVHLFESDAFENEVAEYIKKCSQEDLRRLLSQGHWLEELMEQTKVSINDKRFDGTVPECTDSSPSSYYIRFVNSESRLNDSRVQCVWDRLNAFSTFPGRLSFLRRLIFRGYLVEHSFNSQYQETFMTLFPTAKSVEAELPMQIATKEIMSIIPDTVKAKKIDARNKLGNLM